MSRNTGLAIISLEISLFPITFLTFSTFEMNNVGTYLILENLKERSRKENTQFCLAPKRFIEKKTAVEITDKQTNLHFNVITSES